VPWPPAEESRECLQRAGWSVTAVPDPARGWRVQGTVRHARLDVVGPTEAEACWHALLLAEAMLLGPRGEGAMRKRRWKVLLVVTGAGVLVLLPGVWYARNAPFPSNKINPAAYERIKGGMGREEVEAVIGLPPGYYRGRLSRPYPRAPPAGKTTHAPSGASAWKPCGGRGMLTRSR
jgi:hypothetical protein